MSNSKDNRAKTLTIKDLQPPDRENGYPKNVPKWYRRFFEIFPGLFTWTILLSPIISALLEKTDIIVVYVSFLTIYWAYRGIIFAIALVIGYFRMKRDLATDWVQKVNEIDAPKPYYVLICPVVKEGLDILEPTMEAWAKQDIGAEKISIVFALEQKFAEQTMININNLKRKYETKFRDFITYIHPNDIVGEVTGVKGANINWATRHFVEEIENRGENADDYLLISCDSDLRPHHKYLSSITYKYLTVEDNRHCFYTTAVHTFENNLWRVPPLVRAFSTTLTLVVLHIWVTHKNKKDTWSEYVVNLDTVKKLHYWDPAIGIDDTTFYWNAQVRLSGKFRGEEVYIPTYNDAVENESFIKTHKSLYKQQLRWGWGIIVFPMTLAGFYKNKNISFWKKLFMINVLFENQLFYQTVVFMLTFALPIVGLISTDYSYSSASYNLPKIMSYILTGVLLLNIPVFFVKRLIIKAPKGWGIFRNIWDVAETFLVTVNLLTFGFIPAIQAQTEMMFGKGFRKVFYATDKVAIKSKRPKS